MVEKTALIFGISGQDGAYLAHLLLSKGYRVHGTSRDAEVTSLANLEKLGVRSRVAVHSAAPNDFRSTLGILGAVRPDEIYNLAGQSSVALSFSQPVEAFESNAVATLNILECVRFAGLPARLFNAISSDCFGDTEKLVSETAPLRPKSPYAIAKAAAYWAGDMYREAYGMHVCSGILSNHKSPLRPERFVIRKVVSAACRIAAGSKETLRLGNTAIERDWGYTPEYIEAAWLVLQRDQPDDFLIATGESHRLGDFVAAIFAEVGLEACDHVALDETLRRPLDPACVRLDPGKAKKVLGWRARTGMRALASVLVAAERDRSFGPLPWHDVSS